MASYPTYGTVDDADTYWEAHGAPTAWSDATTATKSEAMTAASEYLDHNYGTRWVGTRATSSQVRDWPRINGEDIDGNALTSTTVPQIIDDCVYYLALRYIQNGDLMPDIATGGNVKVDRIKVGEIETETEYVGSKVLRKVYDRVDSMLRGRGLILTGGIAIRA